MALTNLTLEERIAALEAQLKDTGGGDRLKRIDESQDHQGRAIFALTQIVSDDKPEHVAAEKARTQINAVNPKEFVFSPKADAPVSKSTEPRILSIFSVWTGAYIPNKYRTVKAIADDIKALALRTGRKWDVLEWIIKAGEAGDWQLTFSHIDMSPNGMNELLNYRNAGLDEGIDVIPFINVRGHQEWNSAEWRQIAMLAGAFSRVVLNLEPGDKFWDNPRSTDPNWHQFWWDGLRKASPDGVFELAAIPRVGDITRLGGVPALKIWLNQCALASWECYANSDQMLRPDIALPLISNTFEETNPDKLIPICVWSGYEWWAKNSPARVKNRLEVWTINAD